MYNIDLVKVEEIAIDGGARRLLTTTSNNPDDSTNTKASNKPQASLGVKLSKGKSLVSLSNMLSPDELEYLVKASMEGADHQKQPNPGGDSNGDRICIRMPTQAAAHRQDIPDATNLHDPLSEEVSQFVEERILERIFHFIDTKLCPSVKKTLFGNYHNTLELFQLQALEWSNREPAVNVYYPPDGYFGLHKDNKALTILLPLTSPKMDDNNDDTSVTFTKGGTAFWSQSHPKEGIDGPSLTLAPKAGTALLFGGQVYHKGLPIASGHRVVFVASFSKRSKKSDKTTWMVSAR